nr:sulfotransferase domain-containing protein [Bacteroidales bacterium]
ASSDTYLLIDKDAPKRIFDYNPNMKIIIMLREPVARAYSSYVYAINNGHEKKNITFRDTYNNEKENIKTPDIIKKNNLGHFYSGLYCKHIKYWMQFFPKENFLIIKTNDLKENYQKVLIKVSEFLNIEEFTNKTEIKTNEASRAKFMLLHKFLIDRNSKLRKFLAKIFPNSLKETIFNSGIIEKINNINKKANVYKPISKEDIEFVNNYFENDLKLLKDEFDISF